MRPGKRGKKLREDVGQGEGLFEERGDGEKLSRRWFYVRSSSRSIFSRCLHITSSTYVEM